MASDALRSQVATKWQDAFKRLNNNQPGISGLLTFSESWTNTLDFVRPVNLKEGQSHKPEDLAVARKDFEMVNRCRRLPVCLEIFLDELRQKFYLVREDVDSYLAQYEQSEDPIHIYNLIFRLKEWYDAWLPSEELGATIRNAFILSFQTQLYSILGPTFVKGFKDFIASTLPSSDPEMSDKAPDIEMWVIFEMLGFLDRYESIIASAGYEHIEAHVLENCAGQWATPMMDSLRAWMSEKIVPWMLLMYGREAATTDDARVMLANVGSRFDFHMAKTLCDLRTREIFDIIVDYPDSAGALHDLKDCLQRVDQRGALVKSLRKANRKRLLHPGADTRLILSQYVATIKCLRIVDPPGVLLFKVADPIRRYLRERPDTIRCIVSNLVGDEDSGDSLVDESEPIVPLQQPDIEDYTDPNWEPEPIDAGPVQTNRPSDVISTLVSIYDSKDLFVKELQVLLAQRLLAITDDNVEKVDKERRNIEILKIRFGEAALQVCEVMLKDMTDSKRIDGHVQSQKASIVHPTIISRQFWPMLESSEIVMPGQFQVLQDQYAKEFIAFKPDKRLRWLPHLGTVHLELQLEDRTVEADVPPLEAAFIELFSGQSIWKMNDLITAVGSVDRSAALKALLTWVDKGVLKEDEPGTFRLLEIAEEASPTRDSSRIVPAQQEIPPVASLQQQQAEQMKIYWKFIEGMLTNLGQLPLDRIQTMLKFAPGYDQTVEQLAGFMEAARREGLVAVKDGIWKLTPK
ncbi:hypothetical protein K435DRAFT_775875 [Dendrothele bispora CBS 962.96]|uniref:Anaphase-promoting complex subunit 2 n=1 Tax=Dendrothele bispora (strain CBS 962.96) TaxID=1314807 RepID=A0A4S8MH90_DENBC|nr:hypothetical protein K435DRAFT_775875 [Dendrothele bispora CBS 962.96]